MVLFSEHVKENGLTVGLFCWSWSLFDRSTLSAGADPGFLCKTVAAAPSCVDVATSFALPPARAASYRLPIGQAPVAMRTLATDWLLLH